MKLHAFLLVLCVAAASGMFQLRRTYPMISPFKQSRMYPWTTRGQMQQLPSFFEPMLIYEPPRLSTRAMQHMLNIAADTTTNAMQTIENMILAGESSPFTYEFDMSEKDLLKIYLTGFSPTNITIDICDDRVCVNGLSQNMLVNMAASISLPRGIVDPKQIMAKFNTTDLLEIQVPHSALEPVQSEQMATRIPVELAPGIESHAKKEEAKSSAVAWDPAKMKEKAAESK